jgi:hypothetical protein
MSNSTSVGDYSDSNWFILALAKVPSGSASGNQQTKHLKENISGETAEGTNWKLVGRVGIEPTTKRLKVFCSTD